jgi:membrane protein involved in colicin uptake
LAAKLLTRDEARRLDERRAEEDRKRAESEAKLEAEARRKADEEAEARRKADERKQQEVAAQRQAEVTWSESLKAEFPNESPSYGFRYKIEEDKSVTAVNAQGRRMAFRDWKSFNEERQYDLMWELVALTGRDHGFGV